MQHMTAGTAVAAASNCLSYTSIQNNSRKQVTTVTLLKLSKQSCQKQTIASDMKLLGKLRLPNGDNKHIWQLRQLKEDS